MSIGTLLALVCIILGFVVGVTEDKILFDATTWFVAAIAFALSLTGVGPTFGGKSG